MRTCRVCGNSRILQGHGICQACTRDLSCKTKKCKTRACEGLDGYCISCFRHHFPQAYVEKLKKRRKACRICGKGGYVQKLGMCHVCVRARTCSKCDFVDMNPSAPTCRLCHLLGRPARVVSSCASCFTEEERSAGLCSTCLTPHCDHCGSKDNMIKETFSCSAAPCACSIPICVRCWFGFRDMEKVLCRACWHRTGDLCVDCGSRKGRRNLNKFRRCEGCFARRSDDYRTTCHHCKSNDMVTQYDSCSATDCDTRIYMCYHCQAYFNLRHQDQCDEFFCKSCWHKNGDLCLHCGIRKAPRSLEAFRYCRQCTASTFCDECTELGGNWELKMSSCRACSWQIVEMNKQRRIHHGNGLQYFRHLHLRMKFAQQMLQKRAGVTEPSGTLEDGRPAFA